MHLHSENYLLPDSHSLVVERALLTNFAPCRLCQFSSHGALFVAEYFDEAFLWRGYSFGQWEFNLGNVDKKALSTCTHQWLWLSCLWQLWQE
ncbi:hypothetical protein Ancab_028791 [Ancistrocladus abbreviatus]